MAIFRPGTNRLWAAFATIYLLAAFGLGLYWLFTESGPVAWLAALQGKVMAGRWFPKLTFIVLLLAELVPLGVLKLLIERVTGTPMTAPLETPPAAPPAK